MHGGRGLVLDISVRCHVYPLRLFQPFWTTGLIDINFKGYFSVLLKALKGWTAIFGDFRAVFELFFGFWQVF